MISVAVTKWFEGFTLDVSWQATEPVAALVGPSGSGKTLTLQCLAGLVRPDRGRIELDGQVLFDAGAQINCPTRSRRLGYVFQGYALFPHMTVRQNIAFGLRGTPRASRASRIDMVIGRLELDGLEERYPRELSGGQQQRVALGRALATDPDILLLDEPLSALDAPLRRQLRDDLVRAVREWGKATVLVTHDLSEAYQVADRVIVYEHGRVLQSAPRSDLLWQPASEAVARILGIRNILRGIVTKAKPDRIQFRWRGQALEAMNLPARAYLPPPESPIAFFIRPEYVRLIRKNGRPLDPEHHTNIMNCRVVREVDMGAAWTLLVRLDEPGPPAQGDYDLEVEVPRMVYEILGIDRDRQWEVSIHRGSIHVLPG